MEIKIRGEAGNWRGRTEPAKEKDEEKGLNQCTPTNPVLQEAEAHESQQITCGEVRLTQDPRAALPAIPQLSDSERERPSPSLLMASRAQNHSCHFHSSSSPFLPAIPSSDIFPELRLSPTLAACIHHTQHFARAPFPGEMNCASRVAARSHLGPGPGRKGSSHAAFGSRSMRISGWDTSGGAWGTSAPLNS